MALAHPLAGDLQLDDPDDQVLVPVRRRGHCCRCHTDLDVGMVASRDPRRRTLTCRGCLAAPAQPGPAPDDDPWAEQRARLEAARPVLADLARALASGPGPAAVEAPAPPDEEPAGPRTDGVLALHQRRAPTGGTVVGHLMITGNGIWVVETRQHDGPLKLSVVGRGEERQLLLGGEDCTSILDDLAEEVAVVRAVLDEAAAGEVEVHSALCFTDTEVSLLQRPMRVRGHHVLWPSALRKRLVDPGPYDDEDRCALLRLLERALPAVVG